MAYRNRKKNYKSSTGKRQKTMRPEEVEELKFLSPDERIQYVIENSHFIKGKLDKDVAQPKPNLNKEALVQKPNKLASKTRIPKKLNKHKKYLDDEQQTTHEKTKPGDNNDTDLSDQINSDSSKSKPNKAKSAKESENTNKIQDKDEVIEIAIDTNDPIVPARESNLNETKIDEKQTLKSKSDKKHSEVIAITINAEVEQTNSTDLAIKTKSKNKDSKLLAQRQEQMKEVKLSNGVSLSLTNYQCDHCQRKFGKKSSLRRHMLMHLDLKPYSCSHCPNRKFRQRDNWRVHMARKHKDAFKKALKYDCKICKKPFVLLGQLKLHLKAHALEKQHTCKFCEKVFKEQRQLAQHEKYHMTPGRYKCATCSMSYGSRALYSEHLKSHRQAQDFSCQVCGKAFLRANSIARHIRVSHGGMRRQCPVCKKLLKGHLNEHMRMHENERPHECDVCGQRFTQSTQLTVHKRSHTGVRPYPCRICKQPFSNSNSLMLHIRRHTGEKPFECAMCPKTFSQLPHMKAHMRNIHNKTEFYKCHNCNTFFKLKTLLEAHAEECEAESVQKKDKGDDTLVSRLRFLLALHFAMTTSKEKLKDLGFNKRLIDDILVEWIEARGLAPCAGGAGAGAGGEGAGAGAGGEGAGAGAGGAALPRLRNNALALLRAAVPKHQMALFLKQNKSTEEMLELLTDDVNKK